MEVYIRPRLSHSNSFGNDAEKDTAGCRALYRKYIVIEGIFRFYVGGALGVDMWAAEQLLYLKEQPGYQDIELIVALPFEGHDSKWDAMSKQRLQIIIHNATKCIVIGQSGTTSDYKKRNYYMVDHADFLLAVYDNNRKLRSGTGQTVNYALKQNLRIIFLHPDTAEIS